MSPLSEKTVDNMENAETDEPNWSDDEEVNAVTIEDHELSDVYRKKPREAEAEESCVIIDGIPIVNQDRLPKLQNVLKKLLEKFGTLVTDNYPIADDGMTKGFMFAEYANPSNAEEAASVLNGYRLDKSHTFTANRISQLNELKQPDRKWKAPEPRPYNDLGNLRWWLLDPKCRDHYAIHWMKGEKVSVYKNTYPEPTLASEKAERDHWTETSVRWSPHGTFITTMHKKGVATWAGEMFTQYQRFPQDDVQYIDYSPSEKYLVLCSEGYKNQVEPNISIWDVRTGELMRTFQYRPRKWPHFKWTHDDQYFACLRPDSDGILIYETQTFQAVKGSKMLIDGLDSFEWSCKDTLMAYFVAEEEHNPARVAVQRFPDRKELRSKNLFNVAGASMMWQDSGDHLAVRVDRYGKRKVDNKEVKYSNMTTHLEIFRIREKDIPVDSFELKEPLVDLKWEPCGFKMCSLQGSLLKCAPVIYSVHKGVQLLKTLDAKQGLNTILWAPQGGWVVACGLRSGAGGTFIFIDTSGNDVNVTQTVSHDGATDAAWDPTGRYLVTFVSMWKERSTDLGYRLWSFQGRELMRQNIDGFGQFLWRPRPPSLMTDEKIREVKKKIKSLSLRYEEEDSRDRGQASKEVRERMQTLWEAFREWREGAVQRWTGEKEKRDKLRVLTTIDNNEHMEEEIIEIPIDREETVLIPAEE